MAEPLLWSEGAKSERRGRGFTEAPAGYLDHLGLITLPDSGSMISDHSLAAGRSGHVHADTPEFSPPAPGTYTSQIYPAISWEAKGRERGDALQAA